MIIQIKFKFNIQVPGKRYSERNTSGKHRPGAPIEKASFK